MNTARCPSLLKCEHIVSPLGVDIRKPRLSWIPPKGERGSSQKAYRVICAKTKEAIKEGQEVFWDSGVIETDECNLVSWQGPELEEATTYWWMVKTWADEESQWSKPSSFTTGIFNPSSWRASWISMSDPKYSETRVLLVEGSINSNRYVAAKLYRGIYLRKEVTLHVRPTHALAFFCGLGYGEFHVNGKKVGDHWLDPAQTDYRSGALYSTFDITDVLHVGSNALGIILGNGRYLDAYGYGPPRAILQIKIEFDDGSTQYVVSNDSWAASHGPLLKNGIYDGETYDAQLEVAGWDEVDASLCSSKAWLPVCIVEGHPLSSQTMQPIRITNELAAIRLSSPKPGVFVFDFGQNFAGVVRLKVEGSAGTQVQIRFAELIDESGNLLLGTNRESQSCDTYVLKGEGVETWMPRFTYHGFRYAEITGYPGTPRLETLTGIVLHSDVPYSGTFVCSEPIVNAIHNNVLWGQLSNLFGIPTDCPQRGERMGWLGDAQLTSEEACANFDMAAFYIKYLNDIAVAQKADGSLSDVVPPFWPLYPADPAWASAYATLVWAVYWNYGDIEIVRRHYDGIRRYVDFLNNRAKDNILSIGSYGDWCPPGSVYPKRIAIDFTSTLYLFHDTILLSKMAELVGKNADAEYYAKQSTAIIIAFNNKFLEESGRYSVPPMTPIDRSVGQTAQVLPLALGIVPEQQRNLVVERLLDAVVVGSDCHIDAGIVGTRYLLDVLTDNGFADVAWKVVTQTTYPGWGYMIQEGATTLWERWEKLCGTGMNSHNHIMFGSVDEWFYSGLCGLVALSPGWTRIRVSPKTPGTLSNASASRLTPRGRVSVTWSRSPWQFGDGSRNHVSSGQSHGIFELRVSIPDGIVAFVDVPYADLGDTLQESGLTIWNKNDFSSFNLPSGIRNASINKDIFSLEIESGDYSFVVSW